ncbi:hypothetical protein KKH23_11155, partial [Patescibacteria group bacterium]|nr:hypothetical protein [Patescibacteria group bacterium]
LMPSLLRTSAAEEPIPGCELFAHEPQYANGVFTGTSLVPISEVEVDEWGPRIPSPERLEAMEQVCAAYPWDDIDRKGNMCICRYCEVRWDRYEEEPGHPTPPDHDPACPWKRAQPKEKHHNDTR